MALVVVAGVLLVQGQAEGDTGEAWLGSPYVVGAAMFGLVATAFVVVYLLAALRAREDER